LSYALGKDSLRRVEGSGAVGRQSCGEAEPGWKADMCKDGSEGFPRMQVKLKTWEVEKGKS
jgi:hypothetical protein